MKYKGYCIHCFVHMFPNERVSTNYKCKENEVVQFIQNQFPSLTITHDKTIPNGCSRKRPDVFIDLGYQVLIVEIDEDEHIDYDCLCENKRTMLLSQDIHHRPLVFIRFNPDGYTDSTNTKISSCFAQNKKGVLVIKPSKRTEWQNRLTVLSNTIQYWMENKTDKTIEIVHLFYSS